MAEIVLAAAAGFWLGLLLVGATFYHVYRFIERKW